MRGRLFGIKKSLILNITAVACLVSFLTFVLLSIFVYHFPELWFYSFFINLGIYETVKSLLFKTDSAFYLGTLLFFVGGLGFVSYFSDTQNYIIFYVALAFIVASILTTIFCGQRFHLIFAFSIFFVAIYGWLFSKKIISFAIFIAFVTTFLVLFIVATIIAIKRRR